MIVQLLSVIVLSDCSANVKYFKMTQQKAYIYLNEDHVQLI